MIPRKSTAHEVVLSRKAPKPIGPYSQAIKIAAPGAMCFVSGQIPLDPAKGTPFTGDIARQAEMCLMAVKAILADGGFGMDDVVRCTIYLTDLEQFTAVNEVYGKFFTGAPPARTTIGVAALPKGVGVEIDAIAVKAAAGGGGEMKWEDFK
jgi:2-iminobutanoate/2-iminopropanoate deaminase